MRTTLISVLFMGSDSKSFIILTSEYPPETYGGIAYWASNFLETLTRSGYEAVVLTHKNKLQKKVGVTSTDTVRYIHGHDWKKFHWLYRLPVLLKLLLTRKNVVVIASTWDELQIIYRLKPLFGFRIYCSSHGTDITKHVFPKNEQTIRKIDRIFRSVDLFIPVSHSLDRLARTMFPALTCKSIVLGCNVDTNIFRPVENREKKAALKKKLGIDPAHPLMITVGRMMAVKGFRHVIMALPHIIESIPDIRYMIIAQPQEPEYLLIRHLISELGLERHVIIKPPIKNSELPEILQAADLFVLTSEPVYCPHYQEEGLPRVIPEASACGLPVIVSSTGGLGEAVIDNETGFVVAHGSQDLLRKLLITVLTHKESASEMGKKGRRHIEKEFSNQSMITRILDIVNR